MSARLVADGLTNREIAVTMHYSVKTVEVYLTRLYAKTECRSRLRTSVRPWIVATSPSSGPSIR